MTTSPFTKLIEMQFAPAGRRTKFVGFIAELRDESGLLLFSQVFDRRADAEQALNGLVRELLLDYAERGLVDTLPEPIPA